MQYEGINPTASLSRTVHYIGTLVLASQQGQMSSEFMSSFEMKRRHYLQMHGCGLRVLFERLFNGVFRKAELEFHTRFQGCSGHNIACLQELSQVMVCFWYMFRVRPLIKLVCILRIQRWDGRSLERKDVSEVAGLGRCYGKQKKNFVAHGPANFLR